MHNGVTGHRGNPELFPENTLASFASALALGVDWIELDIRKTRDGRLAVIHDADTCRVGDHTLIVADSTYSELLAIDVATGYRREHGASAADCPVRCIPLLEEVLALVAKHPGQRVSIQPKSDYLSQALALVASMGLCGAVGFNDGDLDMMQAVKRFDARIPVFWDRCGGDMEQDAKIARDSGFECIVQEAAHLDVAGVALLHRYGLQAGVWTVNREEDQRRFLTAGVDRIYTDRPAALIRLRRELGIV